MEQKDLQKVGESVVKTKGKTRSRPDRTVQTEPGDNAKYIRNSLRIARLGKVDMTDAQAVEDRIFEYFTICEEDDMKPSVAGLALALDVDRTYLWEIRVGRKGKNPAVANTLKRAMKLLDLQMVDYMQNGKINPVSGIFLMKNNFGYADKQEVVVTPSTPLGDQKDMKELEAQYRDSVPIDVEGAEIAEGAESENLGQSDP